MKSKNKDESDYYIYNHDNKKPVEKPLWSCTPTGCLLVILLSIAIAIAVQECKRSNIRLKHDREKYEKIQDRIQKQVSDTMLIKFGRHK